MLVVSAMLGLLLSAAGFATIWVAIAAWFTFQPSALAIIVYFIPLTVLGVALICGGILVARAKSSKAFASRLLEVLSWLTFR